MTGASARGKALLARLVADATAAGVEPEAYLDRLRAIDRAIGGLGRIGMHPSGDELRAALDALAVGR